MIRKWLSEITVASAAIFATTGTISGIFFYIYGPWSKLFGGLFVLMAIDVITGVMKAIAKKSEKTEDGSMKSSIGINGLFKKVCILLCVAAVYAIACMFSPDINQAILARDATICGFAFFEFKSIIENLGKLGVNIIPYIKKFMDMLKKRVDADEPIIPSNWSMNDHEAANDENKEEIEPLDLGKDEGNN